MTILERTCPVDARSAESSGSQQAEAQPRPRSSEAGLEQQFQELLQAHNNLMQMHQDLMAMVGALLEQNQQTLAAVASVTEDFDGPATHYMDGTPV